MIVNYVLCFLFEGIEENQQDEIKYSLLSGLIQGGVTSEFTYQLPFAVSFFSKQLPEIISAILDRINNEVFPPGQFLRYYLAEINPDSVRLNINTEEQQHFKQQMAKR